MEWKQNGRGKVFNHVCDKYGIQVDIKQLVEVYRKHEPSIHLYEDADLCLKRLTDKKIPIGIITDGNSTMQWNKLRALGLDKQIPSIIVTDDLGGSEFWKLPSSRFSENERLFKGGYERLCIYWG
ncbi:HAD family hydrolase [Niallia circulans]